MNYTSNVLQFKLKLGYIIQKWILYIFAVKCAYGFTHPDHNTYRSDESAPNEAKNVPVLRVHSSKSSDKAYRSGLLWIGWFYEVLILMKLYIQYLLLSTRLSITACNGYMLQNVQKCAILVIKCTWWECIKYAKSRYIYYHLLKYYILLTSGALEWMVWAEHAFRGCILLTQSLRTINPNSDRVAVRLLFCLQTTTLPRLHTHAARKQCSISTSRYVLLTFIGYYILLGNF